MVSPQPKDSNRGHAISMSDSRPAPVKSTRQRPADLGSLISNNEESPDGQMKFFKMTNGGSHNLGSGASLSAASGFSSESAQSTLPQYRKPSLLTQALTSPELGPLSDMEAPFLTSDGGMTSPARTNTPSPPLPTLPHSKLGLLEPEGHLDAKHGQHSVQVDQGADLDRTKEVKVEELLGRRRCISFACLQKDPSQSSVDKAAREKFDRHEKLSTAAVAQTRTCMLRFACPMKSTREGSRENNEARQNDTFSQDRSNTRATSRSANSLTSSLTKSTPTAPKDVNGPLEDIVGIASEPGSPSEQSANAMSQERSLQFNRVDFQKCEATRFHEFAGSFADEDEWTNEQTAFRQKITINDTLRKENAIRRLAEEAEEEAREEDDELYDNLDDDLDDTFDDGNETDDEEGFADSDDESNDSSAYQFWTPGLTTAATSTDHMEHIRPRSHRTVSESSVESTIGATFQRLDSSQTDGRKVKREHRARKATHFNPLDLPDSSDFVVGTIDEDQAFEEECLLRMKQRERSRQKIIPQDIDPSFPTSDPEAENDDDDDEVGDLEGQAGADQMDATVAQRDARDALSSRQRPSERNSAEVQSPLSGRRAVPNSSPRRLHSPPASRRLFGQGAHRLRSPPPLHRKLLSPPSSRRPSLSESLSKAQGVDTTRLAQRPYLTYTASLPRTPNPFWRLHKASGYNESGALDIEDSSTTSHAPSQENLRRGPIEIVQGLENRRQRRKDKFWRQQCSRAHAGKERERRCQPGKGAQRMREVGLVMADRFKGYKQDAQLILSV